MDTLFFNTPETAVKEIKNMLLDNDWTTLSGYYDLKDSEVSLDSLLSGEFFLETEKPDIAHPGGFWRYKHPFPPSFSYLNERELHDNIYEITLQIRIDQGGGEMQQGIKYFYMKKYPKGYKILPGTEYP